MSKQIAVIPLSAIERISIVFGNGRSIENCKGTADYIMNAGFYDMKTGKPVGHLKAEGTVYSKESWRCWGYTWDKADIGMRQLPDSDHGNYISGVSLLTPWDGIEAPLTYAAEVGGSRPRTAMALDAEQLILYCADTPVTPETLRDQLFAMGAETALMLDGGGSSQCDFMGKRIQSNRRVNNYIAVWLKKAENNLKKGENGMERKKVVLDPGHGVETPGKCAPDKSYYEHEFNLDMAKRLRVILERHGVMVSLTRADEHEPCPNSNTAQMETDSLSARVKVSNAAEPDLFVSIHSNASGNGNEWTQPNGYCVYTSSANDTAGRNVAAKAILAQVKKAGITIRGDGLVHNRFYVLRNTDAPAVLIEHGFHTNKAEVELLKSDTYRDKLAEVDAKGILDYLGIAWKEPPAAETQPTGDRVCCPYCSGRLKIEKG